MSGPDLTLATRQFTAADLDLPGVHALLYLAAKVHGNASASEVLAESSRRARVALEAQRSSPSANGTPAAPQFHGHLPSGPPADLSDMSAPLAYLRRKGFPVPDTTTQPTVPPAGPPLSVSNDGPVQPLPIAQPVPVWERGRGL